MNTELLSLRKQFPILHRSKDAKPLHYLDNAATTFMPELILEAMYQFECNSRSNIQRGMYDLGLAATDSYRRARTQTARYLGVVKPEEVIFNSGTTMAINQLAYGLEARLRPGDELVVSIAEHHSNFVPWQMLAKRKGLILRFIPVNEFGCLDLNDLAAVITPRCKVVALTAVSNVTGAITDISRVVEVARSVNAKVIVDGAQAVAYGPIDVPGLGIDAFAFSGHKCFGPTGIGALWLTESLQEELAPMFTGGGMVEQVSVDGTRFAPDERRFEAGTPPITQAIGLGECLQWLQELPWAVISEHELELMKQLGDGLNNISGLRVLGPDNCQSRRPIFSFSLSDCHPHDICHVLNESGVAVRGGHHCAQPLMTALNLNSTTRVSCAFYNDTDDIEALLQGVEKARELLT